MTDDAPARQSDDAILSASRGVALAVAAALSFAVAMVVMAYGPNPAESGTVDANSFSSSAIGHRLLAEFLRRSGLSVSVQRAPELLGTRSGTVVVVAEPTDTDDFDSHFSELRRQAAGHDVPIVLILPKWRVNSRRKVRDRRVESVHAVPDSECQRILDAAGGGEIYRSGTTRAPRKLTCTFQEEALGTVELIRPQFVKAKADDVTVASTREGALIIRRSLEGNQSPLYIVSDPDLFNNHGLQRGDNVLLVHRLFKDSLESRAVSFDEVVHGYRRSQSFFAELLRFPLVIAVLHGVFLFALMIWAGSVRFGKPRPGAPRLASGRRGLIDNTAKLLAYGGRIQAGVLRYFEETVAAVGTYYHLSREQTKNDLIEHMQAISMRRGVEIDLAGIRKELLELDERQKNAASRAVWLASKLHRWREEMMDAT